MRFGLDKISSLFATFLLAALIISCEEETLNNVVVTEDVLYISGDVVRLTGRVVETNGSVADHGFQIDDNPEFASPDIVSLGTKEDGLGRFIGEYEDLSISTNYYFRSFINVNGEESVGQTNEFQTLIPGIDSFHPPDGGEGISVFIQGTNFTKNTKVMFGDREVPIVSIEEESLITVRVPPIDDEISVPIKVIIEDTTMTFPTLFNYHFGKWQLENEFFDNTQVYETAWLKDGTDFIVGLGAPDGFTMNNKFWKLDLTNYSWAELTYPGADFALARQPFNAGLFWGSGDATYDVNFNEPSDYFWKYNNGIFEQQTSLPFQVIGGVAQYIDNKLYVFGGLQNSLSINLVVFSYDEGLDSWDIASVAPVEITNEYPSFSYDGKAYFLQPDGAMWEFDPSVDSWEVVSQFVSEVKKGGMAAVIGNKAYVGLFATSRQVWEWEIPTNTWIQKSIFNGTGVRDINQAAFAHDNKIFFFRSKFDGGVFEPDPRMELWSLDPNELK